MSAEESKASAQVLRALDMLEMLAGEMPRGLSNKDIAVTLRCPPPYITRTADTLIQKGWIEKDEATQRFRITGHFSRLTFRVLAGFERAKTQLEDTQRNYTLD